MSMTDPIADYLTRIRNAAKAKHKTVDIPTSKLKKEITKVLLHQNYITGFTEVQREGRPYLRVELKYSGEGDCAIEGLLRISTPGLRKYVKTDKMPRVVNNLGIAILSTPKGILTNKQAAKAKIGGEVLCYIW